MSNSFSPIVEILPLSVPTVYLDTNIVIELFKYSIGHCTDKQKDDIGKLYAVLQQAKEKGSILCPSGNQLQEIGFFERRIECRRFYYSFLSPSFLSPNDIFHLQKRISFEAFKANNKAIILNSIETIENEPFESRFIVDLSEKHDTTTAKNYSVQKKQLVESLNKAKEKNYFCQNFDEQLRSELNNDFQLFEKYARGFNQNEELFSMSMSNWAEYHIITGDGFPPNPSIVEQYSSFLKSPYHHFLPSVWIQSNLWALYASRPNKFKSGDNLDIRWVSAYLPYVDYAITDNAFCEAIKCLKIDDYYKTQVYSLQTINEFVDVLI